MKTKLFKIFLISSCFISSMCYCNNTPQEDKITKALLSLAEALRAEKKIDEALSYYNQVLERDPTNLVSIFGLGKIYQSKKEYPKAIEYFTKKLNVAPNSSKTELELAKTYEQNKNLDEAITHYKKALSIDSLSIKAITGLAHALSKNKEINKAIDMCKKGLRIDKTSVTIRRKLIDLLTKKKNYQEAIHHCDILIQTQKNNASFKLKKAHLLILGEKTNEALKLFRQLDKSFPNNPSIVYNIAYLYKKKGEYEKAINLYQQVIKKEPKNRNAILGISDAYLALGHLKLGFKYLDMYNGNHTNRLRLKNLNNIKGKKILLQAEWLPEDMILYARFIKKLKEAGATKVVTQTPRNLVGLLKKCCPEIDVVLNLHKKESTTFNAFAPISSLPHLFEITLKTIPAACPYMEAPQVLVDAWQEKTKHNPKFKIGIHIPSYAEVPIEQIMEIANLDHISLYVLHNVQDKHLKRVDSSKVVHVCGKGFGGTEQDFLDMAAIIKTMDLIITSDSYVAHLAGALGQPVWVILNKVAKWQWMTKRSDSPWYPTMKLLRQKEDDSWDDTIADLLACADEFAKEKAEEGIEKK